MIKALLLQSIAIFTFLASPVLAANKTTETWHVSWSGGNCTLKLVYDDSVLKGSVKVVKPCSKDLRKVKSFVYTDASRKHMVIFSRKNAKGAPLGSFDGAGGNNMNGIIGDGIQAALFKSASSSVTISTGATTSAGAGSGNDASADCVRYANTRSCAIRQDLKDPKIDVFGTLKMKMLAAQAIYPFSGGKGIAKDEKARKGQCREVKKCEKAFGTEEHWCEVVLSDGFFTGWVKRQDEDWVFLRQGC